jgi:hypothetical protein
MKNDKTKFQLNLSQPACAALITIITEYLKKDTESNYYTETLYGTLLRLRMLQEEFKLK